MNKNSLKNLSPKSSLEARRNGRAGGIKSGEVRRKNKLLKDELLYLLRIEDEKGETIQEKMCLSLVKSAINGNIKAFEVIRNTIGQNDTSNIHASIESKIDDSTIDKVFKKLKEL